MTIHSAGPRRAVARALGFAIDPQRVVACRLSTRHSPVDRSIDWNDRSIGTIDRSIGKQNTDRSPNVRRGRSPDVGRARRGVASTRGTSTRDAFVQSTEHSRVSRDRVEECVGNVDVRHDDDDEFDDRDDGRALSVAHASEDDDDAIARDWRTMGGQLVARRANVRARKRRSRAMNASASVVKKTAR